VGTCREVGSRAHHHHLPVKESRARQIKKDFLTHLQAEIHQDEGLQQETPLKQAMLQTNKQSDHDCLHERSGGDLRWG
jgi:hypothetical protein